MKLLYLLLLFPTTTLGQASVAYYPFGNISQFSVSTNPNRAVWLDARVQTNTLFGSLSTTLCPLFNVSRKERVQYYVGPGVRFDALNAANDTQVLEGYSLHVGVRVAPIVSVPNFRVAFEFSPYSKYNFKTGVLYSYLGFAYQFGKKEQ